MAYLFLLLLLKNVMTVFVILTPKAPFHLVTLDQFSYSLYLWYLLNFLTYFSYLQFLFNQEAPSQASISPRYSQKALTGERSPFFHHPLAIVAQMGKFPIFRDPLTSKHFIKYTLKTKIRHLPAHFVFNISISVVSKSRKEKEC